MTAKSKALSKNEFKISSISAFILALRLFGLFMILPIFSIYALEIPGANMQKIGITLGFYGLSAMIVQPIFGYFSDRLGRIKIIALGLMIFIAGSLVAALAHNMHDLMIGRLLQGAGSIGSVAFAVITDHTRTEVRSKAMAMTGVILTLAFILAIISGPAFAHAIQLPGLFILTAFLGFLGLMFTGFLPRTKTQAEKIGMKLNQLKKIMLDKNIMILNLSTFILHAILIASFVILPTVLMKTFNISLSQSWWMYLSSLLISFILMLIIINLADQKKLYKNCIIISALLIVFAEALFLMELKSLGAITLGLTLFFTGFISLEALLPAWISRVANAKLRGTALGFYLSCQFLGVFVGGCFGGYFASTDTQQFFLYLLSIAVLWFIAISGLSKK